MCLTVSCRIEFIIRLLVYKSRNGVGAENIKDVLIEYKPIRVLR